MSGRGKGLMVLNHWPDKPAEPGVITFRMKPWMGRRSPKTGMQRTNRVID